VSAFVLDCSVTLAWCFGDEASPETDALLDRLRQDGAVVPGLWRWEVGNVLALAVRRGRIDHSEATDRLRLLDALPIMFDTEGPGRAWRETFLLAQMHRVTVYDAAYLELALRTGADLATLDTDLIAAAGAAGVRVAP